VVGAPLAATPLPLFCAEECHPPTNTGSGLVSATPHRSPAPPAVWRRHHTGLPLAPHHVSTLLPPLRNADHRRAKFSSPRPFLLRQRAMRHPSCSPFASRPSSIAREPPPCWNHTKRRCQLPPSVRSVCTAFSSSDGPRLTFPSPLRCCRCFHHRLRSPEPPPPPEHHSCRLLRPPHRR
jgi:hypothetical protein